MQEPTVAERSVAAAAAAAAAEIGRPGATEKAPTVK